MKDESLAVCLGLIPVATMFSGTAMGQRVPLPDEAVACLSNASTGLMTAILCMDLMPEVLDEARRGVDRAAIGTGLGVAGAVLVGLYAATEYQEQRRERTVLSSSSAVPVSTIVSSLVALFLYGAIIGASLSNGAAVKKTVGVMVAVTLAVDSFLLGTETASTFVDHERPMWEAPVVIVSGAALLLLGCYAGGAMQEKRRVAAGASTFMSFSFLGVAVAAALAVIAQSQRTATDKQEGSARWYPTLFIYVGFALVLAVQWTARSLRAR